jgi:hypothetical protein
MNHLVRKRILGLGVSVALTAVFAVPGCKSDVSSPGMDTGDYKDYCSLPKPCQQIAQACHPKDDGHEGKIHDCHETGHDVGTLEACSKVLEDCLTTCDAAPFLDGSDSGEAVEDLGAHCHKDAAP